MTLTSAFAFSPQWCSKLTQRNTTLYAVPAPPQVAAAFVLQHLLSIPAQVSAFAALTGPWHVDVGTLAAPALSCDLAPGLHPVRLGFLAVEATGAGVDRRVEVARTAYLRLGREIADAYDVGVKMSSLQRFGMVEDLWAMALREAWAATRGGWGPTVERQSCCLIYALPGCHECAGCPRIARDD